MRVIFCRPQLTMKRTDQADLFFKSCREILDEYVTDIFYLSSAFQMDHLLAESADADDIFVFFNAEDGTYDRKFIRLLTKYHNIQSRVWAIAMEKNPECRRPPEPVTDKQSFDVSCRNENRNPMKNNMRAIAQIFARKIVALISR